VKEEVPSPAGSRMNVPGFFIDRPVFASVLSALVLLAGALCLFRLPVAEYPEVIPPSVIVHARYPGANSKVIAETVAAPLEEQIDGVEDMLYMQSQSNSDGDLTLTATFRLGTDPDKAQQQVQNRVSQALPRLPESVQKLGVATAKASPSNVLFIHLVSPGQRYDMTYLRNYAQINVRNRLARIPGVGQVPLYGGGEYAMRVWLDPTKVAQHQLTASEVVDAIREQNVQVAAGTIGAPPMRQDVPLQLNVNVQGRLRTEAEFGEIVLKVSPGGAVTSLRDVARVELAASEYGLRSLLDNAPAVGIAVNQAPGANALEIADRVYAAMKELKADMPPGVDYRIVYDTTRFVRASIRAVLATLLEAVALVVLVVIVFLQTWRASLIPLLAVPVSIVGSFSFLLAFGFTLNALSLFGMVLAIGIVVDDAIVGVENVDRNIAQGLAAREATRQAMREVSGPIVAIALALLAVFVPLAFMPGLSGQFYKQFAITIAVSSVISAFNSLTLAPALSARLLARPHGPRPVPGAGGRALQRSTEWLRSGPDAYGNGVAAAIGRKGRVAGAYVVLLGATFLIGKLVPVGFIPAQDKEYLVSFTQLPDGASLERSDKVMRRMSAIALHEPGVESAVAFPGLSVNGFVNASNAGVLFITLKPREERGPGRLSANDIAASLAGKYADIRDALVAVLPPPPVLGLGTIGGFKMQLEDRGALGYERLDAAAKAFVERARAAPELGPTFTGYRIDVPALDVALDRVKAKQLGVAVTDVFDTMQVYLGSKYANDFNRFGRVYEVQVQADAPFRARETDIGRLETRNAAGKMVPLSSIVKVSPTYGPGMVVRYNGYPSADINGGPAPGYASGQAQAAAARIAAEVLPRGIKFEWTELAYQQLLTGHAAAWVLPVSVLLVFLVLAALYESLVLPLAVILIVPMGILSALLGVWLTGGDDNLFTQVGMMVLVALSVKNAILIVEFARELEGKGHSSVDAACEACRLRLRPILMTSIAFVMGVLPLALSSGAGSEMRGAIGIAVFSGMLGVTPLGLLFTPVFYVLLRGAAVRSARRMAGHRSAS
jgi:multidrug efflux pump